MKEEILILSEAAKFLKVSDATLRRWIKKGKLPVFKEGRGYRIRKVDIIKLFQARKESNGNE